MQSISIAPHSLSLLEGIIILVSKNEKIIFINQSALSLYRWQHEEVTGQSFPELLATQSLPSPLPQNFFSLFEGGQIEETETEHVENNNLKKIISWKILTYPLPHQNDSLLILGKDITQLRQTEQAFEVTKTELSKAQSIIREKEHQLQRAEDKIFELDSVIAQAPGNLYWYSKDLVYLGCNENSAKILNMSRKAAIGQNFRNLMRRVISPNESLAETFIADGRKVIETGQPLLNIEEPPFDGPEGKLCHYIANKVPLRNRQGEVYGVLGISTDITQHKQLEQALLEEKKKSDIANQSKTEFIANMSHDIRTPITGMIGMIQLIINTVADAKTLLSPFPNAATIKLNTLLDEIAQNNHLLMSATDELLSFLNEVLDSLCLEYGQQEAAPTSFNLHEVVTRNEQLLLPVAQHKNLSLSYTIEENMPIYLKGNHSYLERILLNLMTNALKFTHEGFVKATISLTEHPAEACQSGETMMMLQLSIEDSGIGIPNDKFETIFENFSRLTSSYTGIYKGAGLGLYAVKKYVEQMQGTITVESTEGKGTCFVVTLPFMIVDKMDKKKNPPSTLSPQPHAHHALKTSPLSSPIPNHSSDSTQARATVLIVEDNLLAAKALAIQLKPFQCQVEFATTGKEAISMVENYHFNLILMDIGLPDFCGIEATRKIRNLDNKEKAQIPIIAVTGHARNAQKSKEALEAGMQDVMSKPAKPSELEVLLNQHIFSLTGGTPLSDDENVVCYPLSSHEKEKIAHIIDWDQCAQQCHGDLDYTREMVAMLAKDLKEEAMPSIEKLYKSDNSNNQALCAALHKMKGGICYLVLPEIQKAFDSFHEMVRSNKKDEQEFGKCYQSLRKAVENFFAIILTKKNN